MKHNQCDNSRRGIQSRNALSTRIFIAVLGLMAIAPNALSQTLSDWQSVKDKKYCESIPYSDLRSDCQDNKPANKNYCKEDNSGWSGKDPKLLEDEIAEMNKGISSAKDKISAFERDKSSATDDNAKNDLSSKIKEQENNISELEKKINERKSRIEDDKRGIRNAIDQAKRCLEVREYVYRLFEKAISKAENESDPEIKPIAQDRIKYWKEEQSAHKGEMEKVRERIEDMEDML